MSLLDDENILNKNAYSSILVILLGISILVSPVQPLNALFPILVTLFGIVILVTPVQL